MAYKFARSLIRLILSIFTRLEVVGAENMPSSGSLIIAANHLGRLDVPLVYYFLDRPDVILLIAEKYQKIPLVGWIVNRLDGIWVDRFNADFRAMRQALARLRAGGVLVLAPEGTRSPTEKLLEAKPGAGYLAAKAGVPILPVAVTGTEDRIVIHQITHFRRILIRIQAGQPFQLPPFDAKSPHKDELLKQYTDEIMCRIAALLPPEYRGFYAEHPRLQQILAGEAEPLYQKT
jgi:1-acyl-sn-glycerol-3-phosphate acyltransferase